MSRRTQNVQGHIAVVTAAGEGVGKVTAPQLAYLVIESSRFGLVGQSPSASPSLAR
jgi:hypothetical protein